MMDHKISDDKLHEPYWLPLMGKIDYESMRIEKISIYHLIHIHSISITINKESKHQKCFHYLIYK